MNFKDAIAAVIKGESWAYRGAWPSPKAIANDNGVVDLWLETNGGAYSPSSADKTATDWILTPDNGDRPPR